MADMCKVFVHTEKTSLPRRLKVPKTIGEKDFMSAVTRKLDLEQKRYPGTDSEIKLILAEEGEDVEPLFDSYCWPLEEDFINIRGIEFLAMPTCLDGVTPRELVWKSSEGKLLDKVPVYFHDKEELKHVEYSDGTLTTSNILGMANRHWKTGSNGVPQFSVAEDGLARLHVRFKRKKVYPKNEPTILLDNLHGKSERHIDYLVLHAFGHALGLCHEHQTPKYRKIMEQYMNKIKISALTGLSFNHSSSRPGVSEQYMSTRHNYKQLGGLADEYDPSSIMNFATYHYFLKDEYDDLMRSKEDPKDPKAMKAKEEIQHSGFMNNLHRINGKPSESDVERVKEIYRRSIEAEER